MHFCGDICSVFVVKGKCVKTTLHGCQRFKLKFICLLTSSHFPHSLAFSYQEKHNNIDTEQCPILLPVYSTYTHKLTENTQHFIRTFCIRCIQQKDVQTNTPKQMAYIAQWTTFRYRKRKRERERTGIFQRVYRITIVSNTSATTVFHSLYWSTNMNNTLQQMKILIGWTRERAKNIFY